MLMDISRVKGGGSIPVDCVMPVAIPAGHDVAEPIVSVTLRGSVAKSGDAYVLRAAITAAFHVACARCLVPVPVSFVLDAEEQFREVPNEDDWEITANMIDLEPIAVNHLFSQIPAKALCGEMCKGLCRTCGADLNTSSCGCQSNDGDERFSVLKQWFSADAPDAE